MPRHLLKTRQYYQSILEDSGSAVFRHVYKINPNEPDYSTCTILKVLDHSDWGHHLHKTRKFPETLIKKFSIYSLYNHWDYQQAWFLAFLIQNTSYSHNWLFRFAKNDNFKPDKLPSWFVLWWTNFGFIPQILKSKVLPAFDLFRKEYNPKSEEKRFPALSLFHMFFSLPWKLKWKMRIDISPENPIPVFMKEYRVKWWDNFIIPNTLSYLSMRKWIFQKSMEESVLRASSSTTDIHFLSYKSHAISQIAASRNL